MNKMIMSIVIAILAAAVGYGSYKWLGPDNPVEQACEEVIKAETGETVDLSPDNTATPAPKQAPIDPKVSL